MKSLVRGLALLSLPLLACSKPKPPGPPSFDLIATALRELGEHPDDVGSPASTARRAWIERVVSRTAVEDTVFAATGDVYRHYEVPEPAWKTLEEGSTWSEYLALLQKRLAEEYGAAAAKAPVPDTTFLKGEVNVDTLSALLQPRIDGFKKELAARHPAPPRPSGSTAKTVWLLPTGHPCDEKQRKAVAEFEKRFPGKAVFVTVEQKSDPELFAPLGRRLTAACVVGDMLVKDMFRLDQFVEMIVGPAEVPTPPLKRPELRFFDAHEHAYGKIDAFVRMLDVNRVECSVIAALPRGFHYTGTHEINLTLLEESRAHPGRIIPLVVLSPHADDPVAELEEHLAHGARGVKLINGHGDYFKVDPLEFDTKPMRALFRYCEEHRVPILWHVNTHLYKHGFLRVLRDFPKLVIVNPHLGGYLSYAPGLVRRLLKDFPNLYLDFSFGTRYPYARRAFEDLSFKREEWRTLLADFPDRFLVGTDMTVNAETQPSHADSQFELYRALFEEENYDFDPVPRLGHVYVEEISEHRAGLRGLHLSDELLRKLYWENPRRIYGTP